MFEIMVRYMHIDPRQGQTTPGVISILNNIYLLLIFSSAVLEFSPSNYFVTVFLIQMYEGLSRSSWTNVKKLTIIIGFV